MNNINEYIKKYANSSDIFDKCEKIGQEFSLHVDQLGELDAEIRDVLLGSSKSADFSKNIIERLGVDAELASKITMAVNREIFDFLKQNIQRENLTDSNSSDIEKAGNFTLEKVNSQPDSEPVTTDKDIENREELIQGLENPLSIKLEAPKQQKPTETYAEPLVDQLMSKPAAVPEKKVQISEPKPSASPAKPPQNTAGKSDPYREAI